MQSKREKDLSQAAQLLEVLQADRPGDVILAWEALGRAWEVVGGPGGEVDLCALERISPDAAQSMRQPRRIDRPPTRRVMKVLGMCPSGKQSETLKSARTRSKPEPLLDAVQQLFHGVAVEQPTSQADRAGSVRTPDPNRVPLVARDLATRRCESISARLKKAAAAVVVQDGVYLGTGLGVSVVLGRPLHDLSLPFWDFNGHSRGMARSQRSRARTLANGQRGSDRGVSLDTSRVARVGKCRCHARILTATCTTVSRIPQPAQNTKKPGSAKPGFFVQGGGG